jgi:hypothetical protein
MICTETFIENILDWLEENNFTIREYYSYYKLLPFGCITVYFYKDTVRICLDAILTDKRFSCKREIPLNHFSDKVLTGELLKYTLLDICFEYNKKCLFTKE